jgi:hypothetical protein
MMLGHGLVGLAAPQVGAIAAGTARRMGNRGRRAAEWAGIRLSRRGPDGPEFVLASIVPVGQQTCRGASADPDAYVTQS